MTSGDLGLIDGVECDVFGICLVEEKGWEERRRMAWVMVGWKSPPYAECAARWVGRTWPKLKKVESALDVMSISYGNWQKHFRFSSLLILETYVITPHSPSMIPRAK
jgi:hypothetical protein